MVSLILNKDRLLRDLDQEPSDELLHTIAMLGVEVEQVTEDEIVVDVTPNRPDLLSQQGMTRALLAFMEKQPGLREYPTRKSTLTVRVDPAVQTVRPYTACAVASNLKLDEERVREIIDIQEKLHVTFCRRRKRAAIGIYPLEAISGNIVYTALPPKKIVFRPLDGKRKQPMPDILRGHPKGREYAHLLEGLPCFPVFLDGKGNVLSVPPIINSHKTGRVTTKTKRVFIEASGHDFRVCHEIIRMICAALADSGATIESVNVKYGKRTERTPDMTPTRQQFFRYYVNRRLGTNIQKKDLPRLLGRMGLGFQDGRVRETHYALIPPYRVDFLHQIDVVEDIGIAYGYENIEPCLSDMSTVASESPMTRFKDLIREVFVGYGLLETRNYHLVPREFQQRISDGEIVTLKSCVSEEYDSLRATLLASLLSTLRENRVHEYPQRLFEIGRVFSPADQGVEEQEQAAVVLAGEDYTAIRQVVDGLLLALGIEAVFSPCEDDRFIRGRCAVIKAGKHELGLLGEIGPRVLEVSTLTVPVAACELNLNSLLTHCAKPS